MYFISIIIGVLVGLMAFTIISRYSKNITLVTALTVFAIVSAMSLTKVYLTTYVDATTYEYFLKKDDPVCRLIATHYPERFNLFIKDIKEAIRNNKGKDTQFFYKNELLNAIFTITAPKASNATIYEYYQSELKLYNVLYKLDPNLVLFMEFSTKYKRKLNPALAVLLSGEDRIKEMTDKKEAVILSAIKTPQPSLTTEEQDRAIELVRGILGKLTARFGNNALAAITTSPENVGMNKSDAAAFIISFYQNILDLGKDDVGIIFKYFFFKQSPSENRNETNKQPT